MGAVKVSRIVRGRGSRETRWKAGETSVMFLPIASASGHPVSAAATGFKNVTRPWLSVTRTASPILARVTCRRSRCSCAAAAARWRSAVTAAKTRMVPVTTPIKAWSMKRPSWSVERVNGPNPCVVPKMALANSKSPPSLCGMRARPSLRAAATGSIRSWSWKRILPTIPSSQKISFSRTKSSGRLLPC